jgi:hypothetical protein
MYPLSFTLVMERKVPHGAQRGLRKCFLLALLCVLYVLPWPASRRRLIRTCGKSGPVGNESSLNGVFYRIFSSKPGVFKCPDLPF